MRARTRRELSEWSRGKGGSGSGSGPGLFRLFFLHVLYTGPGSSAESSGSGLSAPASTPRTVVDQAPVAGTYAWVVVAVQRARKVNATRALERGSTQCHFSFSHHRSVTCCCFISPISTFISATIPSTFASTSFKQALPAGFPSSIPTSSSKLLEAVPNDHVRQHRLLVVHNELIVVHRPPRSRPAVHRIVPIRSLPLNRAALRAD